MLREVGRSNDHSVVPMTVTLSIQEQPALGMKDRLPRPKDVHLGVFLAGRGYQAIGCLLSFVEGL